LLAAACQDLPAGVTDAALPDAGSPDLSAGDADPQPADAPPSDAPLSDAGADTRSDSVDARTSFVAVTFNTGTSEGMNHDAPPDDGYSSSQAKLSDLYYGDGLAWTKAVTAAKAFFTQLDPDVVVFQEIFYAGDCPGIPQTAYKDFFCETWKLGDPTVAQHVLGAGWQVACHPGKPDKCAAVKKSFGAFRGCSTNFCLQGLEGYTIQGCGQGARVGRGNIDLVGGGELTLVNVHGSSGIAADDIKCREKQFEQVFKDLGDGAPGASGKRNLVLGDLNTDPGRMALLDKSAERFNDFVGPGQNFHFISDVGLLAKPTYAGLFNIDHVVSDVFKGSCWSAGVTPGHPDVIQAVYFDHKPLICTVQIPQP